MQQNHPVTTTYACVIGVIWHQFFVVSEMTYTVSSGTLNSTIPYHQFFGIVVRSACNDCNHWSVIDNWEK